MKWQNLPRADEADIEDVRSDAVKKKVDNLPTDEKGDLMIPGNMVPEPDYENPYDPNAPIEDIGSEMQPLRGYGKVQKNLKQWRVR